MGDKGILINNLNTYIGTALYDEFLGSNPEESEFVIYGTYYEDMLISNKPAYVKKMMKRKKPVLFRKYMLERMDSYVFDLHSGRLDDLMTTVAALTKEPLESEKTLIVISSILAWGNTPPKMVIDKPKKKKVEVKENNENEDEVKNEEEDLNKSEYIEEDEPIESFAINNSNNEDLKNSRTESNSNSNSKNNQIVLNEDNNKSQKEDLSILNNEEINVSKKEDPLVLDYDIVEVERPLLDENKNPIIDENGEFIMIKKKKKVKKPIVEEIKVIF